MDSSLRDRLRQRRAQRARKRIEAKHVEFCTECGRATDRIGRRNLSLCQKCMRQKKGET